MNEIRILPIGSGSTGNCIYLEINGHQLLVDLGIGYRRVRDVLNGYGLSLDDIEAVFVTHGHGDHVKAAGPLSHHLNCRIYTGESVLYALRNADSEKIALAYDESFELLPGLQVRMFKVSHDFVTTAGFTFVSGNRKIAYVTDCGQMNEKILNELQGSDVVVIEANHDLEMLRKGPYPYPLKRRIHSAYGHLSNDECGHTVRLLYDNGCHNFLLAHLSLINNTPEIALKTIREYLETDDAFVYVCPEEGNDLLSF